MYTKLRNYGTSFAARRSRIFQFRIAANKKNFKCVGIIKWQLCVSRQRKRGRNHSRDQKKKKINENVGGSGTEAIRQCSLC